MAHPLFFMTIGNFQLLILIFNCFSIAEKTRIIKTEKSDKCDKTFARGE